MNGQLAPDRPSERDVQGEGAGKASPMTGERPRPPRLLPPWLIRSFGTVHRAFYRLTGGRLGLSRPKTDRWGTMCLTTIGRRTGKERSAMLGYYEDGPNLVTIAVNGWADAEPAWWLNLRAHPDAKVELKDGSHLVRARAAEGEELARLWAKWRDLGEGSGETLMADIDGYAARLSRDIAVVVLEPRPADEPTSLRNRRIEMESSRDHRGPMHIEESGTPGSPAILFLHGLGQSSREWRAHMTTLSGFHCLAPDLPGHGRSNHLPMPSNDQLLDELARVIETRIPAGRAHVVGVSWGAFLAYVLMRRHPERVDRAVADGLPLVWPRGGSLLRLGLAAMTTPFLHTRPLLWLYRPTHDPADLRATSRRAWWRTWTGGLRDLSAATQAPCPTLIVAGQKEGFVRPGDAALATLMPHAEAWYSPGLDHCWQRKDPDLHIRMVEAWVSGQELPTELRREPAPSPEMVERVRRIDPGNWYLKHRSRITWEIRLMFRHHRGLLAEAYGKAEGKAIARETMQRFEVLLPDVPYIGGDENPNTQTLYMTAYMLALYQSLRARGETVEGAARLLYMGGVRTMNSLPMQPLLRWQGRRMFDRKVVEQRRRRATASHERRYPDDWVSDFVEGDGHPIEHGLDYIECGVVKYLRREGAPELAPYLCWIDYPGYAAMGVTLTRTQTIAQGGQRCDFRFSRGKPVEVEPEFLHV